MKRLLGRVTAVLLTCGIGMSVLPARVSAMPQLVYFELAAPPSAP